MLTCPTCEKRLGRIDGEIGRIYACEECRGRMVSFAILRRQRLSREFLQRAWVAAKGGNETSLESERLCPHCVRKMREVTEPLSATDDVELTLDICTLCLSVWFDPGESYRIPREMQREGEREEITSPAAKEAFARADLERVRRRAEIEHDQHSPPAQWQTLPAIFGFPVEPDAPPRIGIPLMTWTLAAFCLLGFLAILPNDFSGLIDRFGFIPDEPSRYFRRISSSFFLHAGFWHFLGNVYFLLVFGDNVESELGRSKFLLLVGGAHVTGLLAHAVLTPYPEIPVVGASAGISGIIAYYAIAFPNARVGSYYRFGYTLRWLSMPAVVAFGLWIVIQFFGAIEQLSGYSNISSVAHIAGALVGVGAAFIVRRQRHEFRERNE